MPPLHEEGENDRTYADQEAAECGYIHTVSRAASRPPVYMRVSARADSLCTRLRRSGNYDCEDPGELSLCSQCTVKAESIRTERRPAALLGGLSDFFGLLGRVGLRAQSVLVDFVAESANGYAELQG